jgi:hypothetical protein
MAPVFCIINGNPYDVLTTAVTRKPERGGSITRAFLGNARGTLRWRKRNWSFTVGLASYAQGAALEALDFTMVPCGGAMIMGLTAGTLNCFIEVGDIAYIEDQRNNFGYSYSVSVLLREA